MGSIIKYLGTLTVTAVENFRQMANKKRKMVYRAPEILTRPPLIFLSPINIELKWVNFKNITHTHARARAYIYYIYIMLYLFYL